MSLDIFLGILIPCGNRGRSRLRVSDEGQSQRKDGKNPSGVCFRSDGGCLGLVSFNSFHGYGGSHGPLCLDSGSGGTASGRRFFDGHG